MIRQYLAPNGYVGLAAELHERGDHRRCRRLGQDARLHRQLASPSTCPEPGHIHRGAGKSGDGAHGLPRRRGAWPHHRRGPKRSAGSSLTADSCQGHRQPVGRALVETGHQRDGQRACPPAPGWPARQILHNDPIRRLLHARLGSEAIRVGQALGYQLEDIYHLPPETIAARRRRATKRADARTADEERCRQGKRTAAEQRPSMGQDMQKGRRTEIEFLNGLVVREAREGGSSLPRQRRTRPDIVKRVERGELEARPAAHHGASIELMRDMFGCAVSGTSPYSALILAARITLLHFSVSSTTSFANSESCRQRERRVSELGYPRCKNSDSESASRISSLSLWMISPGVLRGAAIPT